MTSRKRPTNPIPRQWHPHTLGVSMPWLARANGVSVRTMERRRTCSTHQLLQTMITNELAIEMAQIRRRGGVMPAPCRMAIAALATEGAPYKELQIKFRCSSNTIWRCVKQWPQGFDPLTWTRRLTNEQKRFCGENSLSDLA